MTILDRGNMARTTALWRFTALGSNSSNFPISRSLNMLSTVATIDLVKLDDAQLQVIPLPYFGRKTGSEHKFLKPNWSSLQFPVQSGVKAKK